MNIMIFDTETTSLEKPFCYNIGYVIVNVENGEMLKKADYVCEQVWHNKMLFSTAYYSTKRNIYVSRMRARTTELKKFGNICQQMIRDIKHYEIERAYAYNSNFDEKVFNYNCDWFKCNNPFDNVAILDIRGFAHQFLIDNDYKRFCEKYERFTDSGNYSTTAETMYQYLTNNVDFNEEHTALADSIIETEILLATLKNGADLERDYKALKTIPRTTTKHFVVKKNGVVEYETDYKSLRFIKSNDTMVLKD